VCLEGVRRVLGTYSNEADDERPLPNGTSEMMTALNAKLSGKSFR
jgi:hypothetical protein